MPTIVEITETPDEAEAAHVVSGLVAFNVALVGPSNRKGLAALLRMEPDGTLVGGAIGYTAWDWLYVEKVWIDETLRGKGEAARLLDAAEAEAQRRGCKGAWLDTLNPAARRVYERAGYAVCGEIPDFAAGQPRLFLQKRFG